MNNQAADGGGLSAFGSSLQIENCELKSNVATSDGGAMYLRDGGATTISDVLFANNNASSDGGGSSATTPAHRLTVVTSKGIVASEILTISWATEARFVSIQIPALC